jgi:hypothetical protein
MSEEKGTESTEISAKTDNPLDFMLGVVDGVIRGGLTAASIPLSFLPPESNRRVRQAMANAASTMLEIPREISKAAGSLVDQMSGDSGPGNQFSLPRFEEIGERAREFTDRMSKSVQDIGNTVTSTMNKTSQEMTQQLGKVDEWVEKKK